MTAQRAFRSALFNAYLVLGDRKPPQEFLATFVGTKVVISAERII